MILNPFLLLFFLYFSANFFSMVQAVFTGGMNLEFQYFDISLSSLLIAFSVQLLILLFLYLMYRLFLRTSTIYGSINLGLGWGYFLAVIQILFVIFNLVAGVNVAGDGARIEGGSAVNYIFILLQPDTLFLIISVLLVSKSIFYINVLVFLVSMFLRGWMGGVFLVIIVFMIRSYPIYLSRKVFIGLAFFIIGLLAFFPVLLDAKWAMRSGISFFDFLVRIPESITLENYRYAFDYLINRFQHVGHVALLYDASDYIYTSYLNGDFISYWLDGLPQYTVLKILDLNTYTINSFMVEYIFDVENPTWSANSGLAGWFLILYDRVVFLFLYCFLLVLIPFFLIAKYAGYKIFILLSCVSLLYLFHGWFGAYLNFIFYAAVIILLAKFRVLSIVK